MPADNDCGLLRLCVCFFFNNVGNSFAGRIFDLMMMTSNGVRRRRPVSPVRKTIRYGPAGGGGGIIIHKELREADRARVVGTSLWIQINALFLEERPRGLRYNGRCLNGQNQSFSPPSAPRPYRAPGRGGMEPYLFSRLREAPPALSRSRGLGKIRVARFRIFGGSEHGLRIMEFLTNVSRSAEGRSSPAWKPDWTKIFCLGRY